MTRRWTLLAGAIALSLSLPQAAFATPQQPAVTAPGPDAAAADALRELKADAEGAVRVQRDAGGDVAFVSSTDGRAMLDSDTSSPRRAAQEQLAEYGEAFGIDGTTSKAVVSQTLDSATGGSVVRANQVVDGVTVFGGQVVMSLDENQGVVSVTLGHDRRHPGPGRCRQPAPGAANCGLRHRKEPPRACHRPERDPRGTPALRPRPRSHHRPGGRPPGVAVRGDQRLRHPRDRARRHRPRRGRTALQRRPRGQRPA